MPNEERALSEEESKKLRRKRLYASPYQNKKKKPGDDFPSGKPCLGNYGEMLKKRDVRLQRHFCKRCRKLRKKTGATMADFGSAEI